MSLADIAKNLKRLRASKRLSQQVLANKAGLSLSVIKGIELQRGDPRVRDVQAVADALDVRLLDLVRPVRELSGVRFRAKRRLKNRDQVLAQVSSWLDDYIFLEEILEKSPSFSLADIRGRPEDVKEFAGLCRKRLGLEPGEPVDNIFGLLESAGIKVLPLSESNSEGFFGLSVSEADGGPAVIVNVCDEISLERRIFSAAHEFGHLMMHLDAYDVAKVDEVGSEEVEADRFAGHFLMPNQEFEKQWNANKGLNLTKLVFNIKEYFRVSYRTVLYRMTENNLANDSIWRNFKQPIEKNLGRPLRSNEEPNGLKEFDFCEGMFNRLAKEAFAKELISLGRCAELLQISFGEMRALSKIEKSNINATFIPSKCNSY
jgi:Zn-dependent peptidase ImmA (M78 family)/DNA-binding XRE family transcriptional regulator